MTNQTKSNMKTGDWVKLGLIAAVVSAVATVIVQAIAIAIWPEIALFEPLGSYIRVVIFTVIPVAIATVLFAWLVNHTAQPVKTFIIISVVVLIISFIPDYIVPLPHKTFLASTVTAFLHVVVAVCTVPILVMGYQKSL
jgi:hypothetical protein